MFSELPPEFVRELRPAKVTAGESASFEIELNKDEQVMLQKSVDAVKGLVEACKGIDESLA